MVIYLYKQDLPVINGGITVNAFLAQSTAFFQLDMIVCRCTLDSIGGLAIRLPIM